MLGVNSAYSCVELVCDNPDCATVFRPISQEEFDDIFYPASVMDWRTRRVIALWRDRLLHQQIYDTEQSIESAEREVAVLKLQRDHAVRCSEEWYGFVRRLDSLFRRLPKQRAKLDVLRQVKCRCYPCSNSDFKRLFQPDGIHSK